MVDLNDVEEAYKKREIGDSFESKKRWFERKKEGEMEKKMIFQDIEKFFNFFNHRYHTEIRIFDKVKYPYGFSIFVQNYQQFLDIIKKYNLEEKIDVYIGARDRKDGKDTASITSSNFIFLEIDEHDIKKPVELEKIKNFLKVNNIKIGILGFSGGGYHIYIPHKLIEFDTIDKKLDYQNTLQTFRNILQKNNIDIDLKVFDLPRVTRILGSINYKRGEVSQILEYNNINAEENTNNINNLLKNELVEVTKLDSKDALELLKAYKINETDPWLYDLLNKKIIIKPDSGGNSVVFKNSSIILTREELDDSEVVTVGKAITERCLDRTFVAWYGWYRKAMKSEIYFVNETEINNWIDKNNYPLSKYIIKDPRFQKLDSVITKFVNKIDLAKQFYDIQPIYYDVAKNWWLWNFKEFKWDRVDETDILNNVSQNSYANTIASKEKNEILEAFRQYARFRIPEEPKPSWIQFKDKIIDIETDEQFQASPKYFICNPVPWNLGVCEDTPIIDRLLTEWTGEIYKKDLYEILAYCTYAHMKIHRIFCLIGRGRNGKSQYLHLVEKFIGTDNITTADINLLTSRFEVSTIYKKLVCFLGEIDKGIFHRTRALKGLSGSDKIRGEFKGHDKFDFHNYAKPIIATNELPESADKNDGFYARWTIVDFPNQFPEGKDVYLQVPDIEFENLARKCIGILQDLFKRGSFNNDGTIDNRRRRYEEHSNSLDKFIEEFCTLDINGFISFGDFYNKFTDYLRINKLRNQTTMELGKSLTIKNLKRKTKTWTNSFGTNNEVVIEGIKWEN